MQIPAFSSIVCGINWASIQAHFYRCALLCRISLFRSICVCLYCCLTCVYIMEWVRERRRIAREFSLNEHGIVLNFKSPPNTKQSNQFTINSNFIWNSVKRFSINIYFNWLHSEAIASVCVFVWLRMGDEESCWRCWSFIYEPSHHKMDDNTYVKYQLLNQWCFTCSAHWIGFFFLLGAQF